MYNMNYLVNSLNNFVWMLINIQNWIQYVTLFLFIFVEDVPNISLERRWSSRTFRYGYLVTTSPQSFVPPSTASSINGYSTGFGCYKLSWCDGRCVQDPGTYSPWHADPRLLAIPASCSRVADYNPNWEQLYGICLTSRFRHPLYCPL